MDRTLAGFPLKQFRHLKDTTATRFVDLIIFSSCLFIRELKFSVFEVST